MPPPFLAGPRCPKSLAQHLGPVKGGQVKEPNRGSIKISGRYDRGNVAQEWQAILDRNTESR